MSWHQLVVGLSAAAFGLLSAVVPVANAEAFVLAGRAAGWGPASVLGITLGQSTGKLLLFTAARHGRRLPRWHRRRLDRAPDDAAVVTAAKPPGRVRRLSARLLELLDTRRWGLPVVLLAAVVGLPPMYAVAILAGTTTMRPGWFVATVAVGRLVRFSLLALGIGEVILHL